MGLRCGSALAIMAVVSGCAHLPDATIGYYLPTSDVSFKVVRTIACDAKGNPVIAAQQRLVACEVDPTTCK